MGGPPLDASREGGGGAPRISAALTGEERGGKRPHPQRSEPIMASNSAAAAFTALSEPVSLKNQSPLGASTIAPTRRAPGSVEAPEGPPRIAMGWYEPATSTRVTFILPT